MPSPLRNGFNSTPTRLPSPADFHSTVSEQKLRRLNFLILLLRFAAFSFTLASAIFMSTNSSSHHYDIFRFVLVANAIVAAYSFFEMGASIWEILRGITLLPESLQLWFDFTHDQVFAYLLLSAEAAGTGEARGLSRRDDTCTVDGAFCVQVYISVALGFVGFAFLALSALLSGFRLVCHVITGSRFHL